MMRGLVQGQLVYLSFQEFTYLKHISSVITFNPWNFLHKDKNYNKNNFS